jgi:hypothetical protein
MGVIGCERAVQEIGRDRTPAGTILRRERSSCALTLVSTQNDLAS